MGPNGTLGKQTTCRHTQTLHFGTEWQEQLYGTQIAEHTATGNYDAQIHKDASHIAMMNIIWRCLDNSARDACLGKQDNDGGEWGLGSRHRILRYCMDSVGSFCLPYSEPAIAAITSTCRSKWNARRAIMQAIWSTSRKHMPSTTLSE